ncbi:MAG: HAD-IIIA family hydrolase [Candidatus Poseidoniaceae archaeon]|jgi:D-glycero-D-manno-heptose 1,7-bisphosphate phosphatase|nr:HAD-IIIA family hydrolase [Candidatus Poseidoniaceae archaeon]MBL6889098.1 HAD-IIIA family hydrolase [Candidatus Poseidoniaceae archaeon]|tara:strand:+ start:61 stop:675 length:615 start_codon:yes stop_codon:yes gene_type:complete
MKGPVIDGEGWAKGPIAFLDRDGVLNYGREGYVNNPSQMNVIPGAGHAIAQLRESGFTICVVTNQSPIMRGLWDVEQLHTIHEELRKQLLNENKDAVIDMILTCPHRNRDRCGCRKPWPGMLRTGHELLRNQRVLHSKIDWAGSKPNSWNPLDTMVGDRKSDMGAGWAVGARTFEVSSQQGLPQVINRVLDTLDSGDDYDPMRW